jgi:hypothetical protein
MACGSKLLRQCLQNVGGEQLVTLVFKELSNREAGKNRATYILKYMIEATEEVFDFPKDSMFGRRAVHQAVEL